MKRILTSFLVTFLCLSFSFAQNQKKEPGMKKFPRFIKPENPVNLSQKAQTLQSLFEMTQDDELRTESTNTDELGFTHIKHQQFYKGVKVEGATYTVHAQGSKIAQMTGNFEYIKDLDVNPSLSVSGAFSKAVGHVGANQYAWDINNKLGLEMARPAGELVIMPDYLNDSKESAKLAYKFDIYAAEPISRSYVFIDAQNGQVIQQIERIHEADVAATGTSLYNGTVNIIADNYSGSSHRLRQSTSGGGVETYDLNNGTNYGSATDVTSNSSSFTGNATAVQAHYGAEQTYDYFFTDHGRNSYNNTGGVLRSYVSYSSNYVNAFWDGSRMTYGDGDGVNYGPLVSLDIAGHEMSHGVTEFSAGLIYQRESGALNESFSDIFGEMVEYHATGSNDWQMGTDMGIGGSGAIRSMDNPNAYGDPDTYGGTNWYNPNCGTPTQFNDYCGVHINSGVQNKWFYILSVGESSTNDIGNSYNVSAIGRTKASAIAYRNLTVYLGTSSTFADARAGAIQSAEDLYGAGSNEVIQTTNAWYAVGVGDEFGAPASYCSSNGNNVSDEYIQRVQLNTIDNSNTSSPAGGYTNYTSISTDLTKGSNYTITVTPLWTGTVYSEGYSVWIDFNGDADFTDAGEQVWTQAATSSTPVSGSFSIPAGATEGATRMRVSMKYNGVPTSCESFTYGEVEDYTVNITSGGGGDTQAPTVPSGLASSNIQQTSFSLSWNASSDNVGVTGYTVYLNGSSIGTVTGTSANVTGLSAATTYAMTVDAYDAAGNTSAQSSSLNVTTSAAPDTDPPSVPTGLSTSNVTSSSFDASWSASSDNVGVTGYNVYLDGNLDGTTAGTSYSFSGLSASTTYTVTVSAYDAAGNTSAQSSGASETTSGGGGGGTTTLSASFFETGWDDWNDGGSDCARVNSTRSYEGAYSIRIRDNSGTASSMTSDALNLAAYSSVDIEFYFYVNSMETNEDFWLRYNDGSGWQTIGVWTAGDNINNNQFYTSTLTLPAGTYNLTNGAQFRFQCDASGNGDRIYIDAVTITGTSGSSLMAGINSGSISTTLLPTPVGKGEPMGFTNDLDIEATVYPTLATNVLNINSDDPVESVEVYSITGALIFKTQPKNNRIDVSNLSAGPYLITIKTSEETINEKFLKE